LAGDASSLRGEPRRKWLSDAASAELGRSHARLSSRSAPAHASRSGDRLLRPACYRELSVANPTALDYATLAQQPISASYVPQADAPGYAPMMAAVRRRFDATQLDSRVAMAYETHLFSGDIIG
jgi:hypothetical protein